MLEKVYVVCFEALYDYVTWGDHLSLRRLASLASQLGIIVKVGKHPIGVIKNQCNRCGKKSQRKYNFGTLRI